MRYCTCIGIDTHSKKNVVCALDQQTGEIREKSFSSDPEQIVEWIKQNNFAQPIGCVYESGPCGFNLARYLNESGICRCLVAATSKIAYPNDGQKNDKKDAKFLAKELSAWKIHPVHIPTVEEESICRLSKLRGEVVREVKRAKQRVTSYLLLTSTPYTQTKRYWTKRFEKWAVGVSLKTPTDTFIFREKLAEVFRQTQRLSRIEDEIDDTIRSNPMLQQKMERLLLIHGIGRVTAFSFISEIYDFERFRNGAAFANFLGLVPTEHSSGKKIAHGSITKKGNSNLRSLLIEVSNNYSKRQINIARIRESNMPSEIVQKAEKCTTG